MKVKFSAGIALLVGIGIVAMALWGEGLMGIIPLAIVLTAALFVTISYFAPSRNDSDCDAMPERQRRFLALYLLTAALVAVYLIFELFAVRFHDVVPAPRTFAGSVAPSTAVATQATPAAASNQAGSTQAGSAGASAPGGAPPTGPSLPSQPAKRPVITRLRPGILNIDAGAMELEIYGTNLRGDARPVEPSSAAGTPPRSAPANAPTETTVFVSGGKRDVTFASDEFVIAQLTNDDTVRIGDQDVVVAANGQQSDPATLSVVDNSGDLRILWYHRPINREMQLLLIVVVAGALGSYIHAIRSLADFIGNRSLVTSWFWFYVTKPFVGTPLALVFYAAIRGGFMAGSPADVKAVNPFGVFAIAAMVGMFADKAGQKLAEIFDALFKSEAQRQDPLKPSFAISTATLPDGTLNVPYLNAQKQPVRLCAIGATGTVTWDAAGLPDGLNLSADGALDGVPTAAGTTSVTFTATDTASAGKSVKDSKTLTITIEPAP